MSQLFCLGLFRLYLIALTTRAAGAYLALKQFMQKTRYHSGNNEKRK